MTDLEMMRLCAGAMGIENWRVGLEEWSDGLSCGFSSPPVSRPYDPLHDDAQAMALVKKFELNILRQSNSWTVMRRRKGSGNSDLNRAIVECVAKMRVAKMQEKPIEVMVTSRKPE